MEREFLGMFIFAAVTDSAMILVVPTEFAASLLLVTLASMRLLVPTESAASFAFVTFASMMFEVLTESVANLLFVICASPTFALCIYPHAGVVLPYVRRTWFDVVGWNSFSAVIALFLTLSVSTALFVSFALLTLASTILSSVTEFVLSFGAVIWASEMFAVCMKPHAGLVVPAAVSST